MRHHIGTMARRITHPIPPAVAPKAGSSPASPPIADDHDESSDNGLQYAILAGFLVAGVFLLTPGARGLVQVFYNPWVVVLVLVVFAEYFILRARDRSYVLERELEFHRSRRKAERELLDEADALMKIMRDQIDASPGPGADKPRRSDGEFSPRRPASLTIKLDAEQAERLAELLDRLERRV